jgi:hypothetical protein
MVLEMHLEQLSDKTKRGQHGRWLSKYAQQIDLEYSDSPLRLDPRNLTIVADTG